MIVKGEGCYLWDVENRRFLDFTAGIAVNSLGHADAAIERVISQQVESGLKIGLVHVIDNQWRRPAQ
jgi:acetylornithine aminotransferase